MVEVKFYDTVEDEKLKFAVIVARTGGKWVFCRHRERTSYEIPGGHREAGESIFETAARELKEETGAVAFTLEQIGVYSVKSGEEETFGMLFFAEIESFEALHCEIAEILVTDRLVDNWTYPLIQPRLIGEARERYYL